MDHAQHGLDEVTVVPQPYKCNVCGKYRDRDTNHWWLVWYVVLQNGVTWRIEIQAWNDELAKEPEVGHCCGIECARLQATRVMCEAVCRVQAAEKEKLNETSAS